MPSQNKTQTSFGLSRWGERMIAEAYVDLLKAGETFGGRNGVSLVSDLERGWGVCPGAARELAKRRYGDEEIARIDAEAKRLNSRAYGGRGMFLRKYGRTR